MNDNKSANGEMSSLEHGASVVSLTERGDDHKVNAEPFARPPDKWCLWRRGLRASSWGGELIEICRVRSSIGLITSEFCSYFTDIVPTRDGKEPLVAKCLRTGVLRWSQACTRNSPENSCFHAFLYGLFEAVPEVNGWCVCLPQLGDDVVWDPAEKSLWDWWAEHKMRPQLLRRDRHLPPIADSDLRLFIGARVLDRIDASFLPGGLRSILRHLTPIGA